MIGVYLEAVLLAEFLGGWAVFLIRANYLSCNAILMLLYCLWLAVAKKIICALQKPFYCSSVEKNVETKIVNSNTSKRMSE